MAADRWLVTLACGHEQPPEPEPGKPYGKPYVGQWVTCLNGKCQGQRKVVSVEPLDQNQEKQK